MYGAPFVRILGVNAATARCTPTGVVRLRLRPGIIAAANDQTARRRAVPRVERTAIRTTDATRHENLAANRILMRHESARPVLRRRVVGRQLHLSRTIVAPDVHRAPRGEAHRAGLRGERRLANLTDADQ